MADDETGRAARKTAIGKQGARFAKTLGLDVRRRIQHFLHARAALWSFVTDHDDIAFLDQVAKDRFHCRILAFEHARHAGELEDAFIHAGCLDDAAVFRKVAVQDSQSAVLRISVRAVADTAFRAVHVEFLETFVLRKRRLRRHAARRRQEQLVHGRIAGHHDVVLRD